MASSKVMASTSPPHPDLPRQTSPSSSTSSSSSLLSFTDQNRNFGSMSMEEILKNIYSDSDSFANEKNGVVEGGDAVVEGCVGMRNSSGGDGNRTVDEVWREIVIGGGNGGGEPAMTLEDFLTKAGAVSEEDVRGSVVTMAPPPPASAAFGVDATVSCVEGSGQFASSVCMQNGSIGIGGGYDMEFGNRMVVLGRSGGGGKGRGKRRAMEEIVLDKATQQKQRRMIKNRESAARSRERKQAYTVELETSVSQLEEENARLLREEAEQNRKRYKQLMENLIPVVEGKRPPRVLRRVRSMNL